VGADKVVLLIYFVNEMPYQVRHDRGREDEMPYQVRHDRRREDEMPCRSTA
jgi:hypothetical protein